MLDHHIQKHILDQLVHVPAARFADLKPNDMDGNVFTYHLQQLTKAGLIEKTDDGLYCLTAAGKAEGISGGLSRAELRQQAHAILLLCIRDTEGRWLLRKRTVHPMYGRIGFLHGEPKAGESVIETAEQRLKQKTGLSADFSIAGSGFVTIYSGEDLESYTQFTLLRGELTSGELIEMDQTGQNMWVENPDFSEGVYIPSMGSLVPLMDKETPFFVELTYKL